MHPTPLFYALMLCVIFWLVLFYVMVCHAEQDFNPITGDHETVLDGDNSARLNPMSGDWSIQPEGAKVS